VRQPQRPGSGRLAPVNALDPRAIDFGDVGTHGQRQRDHHIGREGQVLQDGHARQGKAEADEVDHQHSRDRPEHVHVGGGDEAQGLSGRPGSEHRQRHDQAPDQHEDLRDQEDLHVDPERIQDQRECLDDQRHQEEGLGDRLVVGQQELKAQHHDELRQRVAQRNPALHAGIGSLDARRHDIHAARRRPNAPAAMERAHQWPDHAERRDRQGPCPCRCPPAIPGAAPQGFTQGLEGVPAGRDDQKHAHQCKGKEHQRHFRHASDVQAALLPRDWRRHSGGLLRCTVHGRGLGSQGLKTGTLVGSAPSVGVRYWLASLANVPSRFISSINLLKVGMFTESLLTRPPQRSPVS
jgi:hypothetical protein